MNTSRGQHWAGRAVIVVTMGLCLGALLCCCAGGEDGGVRCEGDSILSEPVVEGLTDTLRLTQQQVDSIEFRLRHHYTLNYNFKVTADSLLLLPGEGELSSDTAVVRQGQLLVVAQVRRIVPSDSLGADTFLIKVASDQRTMGWVEEGELLRGVVPDDPLSELLNALTVSRVAWMSLLLVAGLVAIVCVGRGQRAGGREQRTYKRLLHQLYALHSVYPTLLLLLTSLLATLYGGIQEHVPEYWQEFYFHPTLNPLLLPPVMAWLVSLMWLVMLSGLAMLFEVYDNFPTLQGILYVLAMVGLATLTYIILYQATRWGVGYVLLPIYVVLLVCVYVRCIRPRVICGRCGHRLREPGVCPQCGAINE